MSSPSLLARAVELAEAYRTIDLTERVARTIADASLVGPVDVLALGKAAPELCTATVRALGESLGRTLVITDDAGASVGDAEVVVGDHPVVGERSLQAGAAALAFVRASTHSLAVLVSGGGSAMCASLTPPVTLSDLAVVWDAAVRSGADIGQLNLVRTATSEIAGGRLLAASGARQSLGLVMVDNIVDGAPGVASGPTYPRRIDRDELTVTLDRLGLTGSDVGRRIIDALRPSAPVIHSRHHNVVLVAPSDAIAATRAVANEAGVRVVEVNGTVTDEVGAFARSFATAMERAAAGTCLIAAGEVGVTVRGGGRGGRCQALISRLAVELASVSRPFAVVARATDGRDHLAEVGGAWLDPEHARAVAQDPDVARAISQNDTFGLLERHGVLIDGERTGWNLCDLYVALVD